MRCPKCAHLDDKVIDSRSVRNGGAIRRRRICQKCGHRFTTYEEVVKANLKVIKREIENLIDGVINELEAEFEREVPSMEIGRRVMNHLEELDEVAYVRFASVYRRFRDVSQFLSEVEGLIGR